MNKREGFVIIWDPEAITPEEYAELVVAIGDLVRAHGGVGIERVLVLGVSVEHTT